MYASLSMDAEDRISKKITDDPRRPILIRRLIMSRSRHAALLLAFLDGDFGGATAGSAYISASHSNKAYVEKNVRGIAILSGITCCLHDQGCLDLRTPILSKISKRDPRNNQGAVCKLMTKGRIFFRAHSLNFWHG